MLSACDPVAHDSDLAPTKSTADQAFANTLRLADENSALRDRVDDLEREQRETDEWVAKLIDQNVQDAKRLDEIVNKYNGHLDTMH